ncbi:MAG: CvpA family protein [Candidatus Sericytochromatia bacterium]|nr:CvpA family protein [Candidatus Sericytochromatia bacterium]
MLKPYFVDLILLAVLLGLAGKGYVTGFIRSVVTALAAAGAYVLAFAMPTIAGVAIHYLLPASSPNYMTVNHLCAFALFFAGLQGVGFLLTGLFENIGLGSLDKIVGLVLGLATGVFVGLQPAIALKSYAGPARLPENQRYFQQTVLMKAYVPLTRTLVRAPRRGKGRRAGL